MKTSFKKSLAVFMAVLMLISVFSISVSAASYWITFNKGNASGSTGAQKRIQTDSSGYMELPDAMFTRTGYVQTGWSTKNNGSTLDYQLGEGVTFSAATRLYPYWAKPAFKVTYEPGAYGVGAAFNSDDINQGESVKLAGESFTRDGYIQTGWALSDGGELAYDFGETIYNVTESLTVYPVWVKLIISADIDKPSGNFGTNCQGLIDVSGRNIKITNTGNKVLTYVLPASTVFDISVVSGSLTLAGNETLEISIAPKADLVLGDYAETLVFEADEATVSFELAVSIVVAEHRFVKYTSDNNATYNANGTMTAKCANGCGATDTIIEEGTKKIYSADNNTALGLSDQYIHHRTVRFTAFGSGTDNKELVTGSKRYLPVSWYVNDEYKGNFDDGDYDVVFTHTVYGSYTLTISYVEEEYNKDTEEWTATGETDEKSFDYTVGATAEEEQEIIMPNTILSVIFGLFAELLKLLGIGDIVL